MVLVLGAGAPLLDSEEFAVDAALYESDIATIIEDDQLGSRGPITCGQACGYTYTAAELPCGWRSPGQADTASLLDRARSPRLRRGPPGMCDGDRWR